MQREEEDNAEQERLEISLRKSDPGEHVMQRMGSIGDRNDMYPTEAEDIKKRWQEYR